VRPEGPDIAEPLLAELRVQLGLPELDYAESPETLADGVTARAYSLRLSHIEGAAREPLVCRVFQEAYARDDQAQVEAALQNALAENGFGVPRVFASGDRTSRVGAPFMAMERAPGRNAFSVLMLALAGASVLAAATTSILPVLLLVALYWAGMTRILTRLHRLPGSEVEAILVREGIEQDRLSFDSLLTWLEQRAGSEESRKSGSGRVSDLVDWLRENAPVPADPPSVCHGDFWFGNLMLSLRRVTLLDWSQACLSHPEFDLGWMSIQHYSRLAVPLPESLQAPFAAILRPFAWMLMGATRGFYRLVRPVDRKRLQYFTAFSAARVLAHVMSLRARSDSGDDAMLSAWGSPATLKLLRKRVQRITGIDLEI
jgi:aminoglycoside phosphotransferase (APT) family kinase protein